MTEKQNAKTENTLRFHVVQDERFVDLTLYQFGWEKCTPLYQFGPAIRNHFLFHYVISGKGMLELNYNTYQLEAGQGFLLCPTQISSYFADSQDPWTYAWVEFDGLRARECLTLAGLGENQPIYTPTQTADKNGLERYITALVDNAEASPIRLVGLAMVLLDELIQTSKTRITAGNKHLRDFYIKEALGYIEANFQKDISIEDIANASGLNRSYFGRLFKEVFGQSPQQFLIHYRMTKAAELLKASRISIAKIGNSVGYENQLHFSRAFKNDFGISPSEYRKKHFFADEKIQ